jgi:hypothetical protein
MSDFLDEPAVSSRSGKDAASLLQAYMNTGITMVLSHTNGVQKQPEGTGAGDHLIKPR